MGFEIANKERIAMERSDEIVELLKKLESIDSNLSSIHSELMSIETNTSSIHQEI